jgi:CRP-like cAMP-binding protein
VASTSTPFDVHRCCRVESSFAQIMPPGKNANPMKPAPYMREHSQHIRFLSKHSGETIEEDPIVTGLTVSARIILVIACRNRQRLLSHAWQLWVNKAGISHNYKQDVITILSRVIPEDELRTEFEIEVIFKWVLQNHHIDPTGIAYTLYMCNSKAAIIKAIQHFRLERYSPGHPIMLQGDFPRPEEGHYTIIHGLVDIVIFPPDSPELLRLHTAKKNKHEHEIVEILNTGKTIDTMPEGAGFGELSTITGMKRSASVRAHPHPSPDHTVDLLVIPQIALLGLLEHRRILKSTSVVSRSGPGTGGGTSDENELPNYPSAEVMDYLRQSGLIYKAAMIDVMEAARCMVKTQYIRGSILYQKGSRVNKIYIILYGEVLLDTRSYEEGLSRDGEPFQHLDVEKCYLLRSGSILGDEGMTMGPLAAAMTGGGAGGGRGSTGSSGVGSRGGSAGGTGTGTGAAIRGRCFESSAIVMSETAVFFEVTGYGITFLLNRLGIEKYSALVYKDIPLEIEKLESLNDDLILHSTFMSLRKAIAMQNPFRGKLVEVKQSLLLKDIEVDQKEQELLLERNMKYQSSTQQHGAVHQQQPLHNQQRQQQRQQQQQPRGSPVTTLGKGTGRMASATHGAVMAKSSLNQSSLSPSRSRSPSRSNAHHLSSHLTRLPSRLSSPGLGPPPRSISSPNSKPSSPMLPSTNTPLGLMLSTNKRLSKAITRRAQSPLPSTHTSSSSPSRSISASPFSPSAAAQKSQTHILRIDSPEHHELTIFETKNYSNLNSSHTSSPKHNSHSHSLRLSSAKGGATSPLPSRGGTSSPPHASTSASRPYSRQLATADKETFFKTLEGAKYKKVTVLKQAALHHVQSIYKLIKKREMRYMRLQATVPFLSLSHFPLTCLLLLGILLLLLLLPPHAAADPCIPPSLPPSRWSAGKCLSKGKERVVRAETQERCFG